MFVYILGGFLGSGKTTLLMKLASMYSKKGTKVAIVVNEAGEVGVDGATLKAEGYDAIELPDGCICCTLSGTLQHALQSIKKDIDPDVIIIEPTGLALPHKVETLVRTSMIDPEETIIIGVADIQRFDDLIKKKEEFFKRQMFGANFILINKADLASPEQLASAAAYLKREYPDKLIISVSNKTGQNLDKVYELMKE
ncbi:MAG: GTP-binding protein [Candidatus Methanomethylophilaceae archaeon]|nr:GTPase [Candidatus Methanomethylophilaceae archaeon]MDD3378829.1 GTP-binding protein [Candidatus Methanomethylophilaceae archaeon]MDY0224291.1 GTP-binding protein [Candidatus Methanomethylophilaceae archaeon]